MGKTQGFVQSLTFQLLTLPTLGCEKKLFHVIPPDLLLKDWQSNPSMHCFLLFYCDFWYSLCSFCHSHCPPRGLQALLVRALLEYSQNAESSVTFGLTLAAGIFLTELIRSWTLALMWAVNYRTAARLRGAALTFAFNKILNLRSTKKVSLGEVLWEKPLREGRPKLNAFHGAAASVWIEMGFALVSCPFRRPGFLIKQLKRHYPLTSQCGNKKLHIFMNLLYFDCCNLLSRQ